MSNGNITYTDSVICYKELIEKEDAARRDWFTKFGGSWDQKWRPIEPFERGGASNSKGELPTSVPVPARKHPELYRDTVGDEGLAGGTPARFGGRWDVLANLKPIDHGDKPPRVVKKGPHDLYCDIGYNCWNMAGKARTHNFGLMGTFEREFWTNTPGCVQQPVAARAEGWPSRPRARAVPSPPDRAADLPADPSPTAGSSRSCGTTRARREGTARRRSSRSWTRRWRAHECHAQSARVGGGWRVAESG